MSRTSGVAVLVTLLLAALLTVADPDRAAAQAAPTVEQVEIRDDHSVLVEWQSSSASSYDVGWRNAGETAWLVARTATVVADSGVIGRVLEPGVDWSPVAGSDVELAVRADGGAWSPAMPVRLGDRSPAVTSAGTTVGWSQSPFAVAYEVWAATPTSPLCLITTVDAATTSTSVTSLPADCGSAAVGSAPAMFAVRALRSTDPVVAHEPSIAVSEFGAVPAERLRTAQVNGRWELVDAAGSVRRLNGINVRRGVLASYAFSQSEMDGIVAMGFDSLRIVMEWERFEPAPGTFDLTSFDSLDRVIDLAEAAGLEVVLDPLHMAEAPAWDLPTWAWERSTDGQLDQTDSLMVVRHSARPYLRHVAHRYLDRDHVIAIDLLNEPREPVGGALSARNEVLVDTYHDLITLVRDIDADRPLMLEPYYGSAVMQGSVLQGIGDPTLADPAPDPADFTNLVWSFHDYYTGREGTAADDGLSGGGYPRSGTADDGTPLRAEVWSGTGCYPAGTSASTCTHVVSRRNLTVPSMTNHVAVHAATAAQAGMALYVGEYGIPRAGGGYQGWGGGAEFLTDKVAIYDSFGASRAVWVWREDIDVTYGLYSRVTREWHPLAAFAAGTSTAPFPAIPGDPDCSGDITLLDARATALYAIDVVTPAAGCPTVAGEIWVPVTDVNVDGTTSLIDARIIAQCAIDVPNELCP